jgi:peptide-methionine (S)-S-oxide reductase
MRHFIFKKEINFLEDTKLEQAMFGMGCFWGAEKKYWDLEGVKLSAVGYAGGVSKSPSYQDVCTGLTGHNEVVKLLFDPTEVSYTQLLTIFWENHDPTQKNRQGNDIGTQYRSGAYYFSEAQKGIIFETKETYGQSMRKAGFGSIVTEIKDAPEFFLAEDYHQQYLAKNPQGYCGLGGTGISLTMNSEKLIEAL